MDTKNSLLTKATIQLYAVRPAQLTDFGSAFQEGGCEMIDHKIVEESE